MTQKQAVTAQVETFKDGKSIGKMCRRWFFNGRKDEPTTEVALRRGIADDLYVVLASYKPAEQSATLKGGQPAGELDLDGRRCHGDRDVHCAAALRGRSRLPRVPEGAATASMILILLLGSGSAAWRAQHVPKAGAVISPRSAAEKDLQGKIVCMCGTCGRQRINECTCSIADAMREELASLTKKGLTNDQVIEYFVKKYGSQEVLASPIDVTGCCRSGCCRICQAPEGRGIFPGMTVLENLDMGTYARRSPDYDADLESKLDDELRDLD